MSSGIFGQFGILYALLALSFLVFFHELGHFLAARFFKVKVEVFSIGFGKRILTKKIGETEYSISAIPLGGYVKMKGQDDSNPTAKSDDIDSYNSKKPWQRIVILFAGPFANFLLAFLLYMFVGNVGVQSLSPKIGLISNSSAAFSADLHVNDIIRGINGIDVRVWDDIKPIVQKSEGEISILVERDGKPLHVKLTPQIGETKNIFKETVQEKLIGISPSYATHIQKYSGFSSVTYATEQTIKASKMILISLQKLVQGIIPAKEMGGVIAIVDISSDFAKAGFVPFLILVAMISVNLGVINLFPIPALDGGHIMFNLYEWIFKRAPSEKVFYRLTVLGWAFLLSLMIFVTINDLVRITNRIFPQSPSVQIEQTVDNTTK
ncbi:MAG: RIP metalloprotease RseP [Campylobacteraceae bacterium]